MQVEGVLFFETPEQIFLRVFQELKPRTKPPEVRLAFRRFANANSFVRLADGHLDIRLTDVLDGAPAPILEALAYILLSKLFRRPVPAEYATRYRRYLNRKDMRRSLELLRQIRGRKFISGPKGSHYNLEEVFEDLNAKYFGGLMARPDLGWSRNPSRTTLGHFDSSHNAIILSSILDRREVSRLAVEYVMFHEMLHLRYPVDHRGARRRVHTRDFKAAEKSFPKLAEARALLKAL